jgi:hypothetical protein
MIFIRTGFSRYRNQSSCKIADPLSIACGRESNALAPTPDNALIRIGVRTVIG